MDPVILTFTFYSLNICIYVYVILLVDNDVADLAVIHILSLPPPPSLTYSPLSHVISVPHKLKFSKFSG